MNQTKELLWFMENVDRVRLPFLFWKTWCRFLVQDHVHLAVLWKCSLLTLIPYGFLKSTYVDNVLFASHVRCMSLNIYVKVNVY